MQQINHKNENLTHFVENYYASMMQPQINTPETFVWFTGVNMAVFNSVTRFYYTQNINAHMQEILSIAPQDRPIAFWIDALQPNAKELQTALEKEHFAKVVTCPFMVWHTTTIAKPSAIIERVTPQTYDQFITIISTVFGLDAKTAQEFGALHARSQSENYILYADGHAVGAGTLYIHDKIGLILNVAIMPEHQRKGLGSHISQYLMYRAAELKLEKVVLNANPIAIKVYERLGFKIDYDLDIYARST